MDKHFQVITGVLKGWEDEAGDQYVTGTTSSTIVDLQGDELTLNALESMRKSAIDNMTMFMNHSYVVPEDVFGSIVDARIVKRADETTGAEVYDLDITVKVAPESENPRAQKAYRAIKAGRKFGLSIGADVTKASTRKAEDGTEIWVIDGIELRESSVVGIPANQRSYFLRSIVKALSGSAERASDRGIPLEIEEKGMGDRMRAAIVKNEAAAEAAAVEAAVVAEAIAIPVAESDEEPTVALVEGIDALTDALSQTGQVEAAPEPEVAETGVAEPEQVSAAAPVAPKKDWEYVAEPGDGMLPYAYMLESALFRLAACDDPAEQASLQAIIASLQELIAAEVAEAISDSPEAVAAAAIPMVQKALDAAATAKSEAAALRKQLTDVSSQKAQVEELLHKAEDLLTQTLALPVGRKSAVAAVVQAGAPDFPWLAPAVAAAARDRIAS